MNIKKEIVAFDLETTGINTQTARILSIAIQVLDTQLNTIDEFYSLVCPDRNPQNYDIESTAHTVHGITKEMVANAPTLQELLPTIKKYFESRDILTYNGNTFDLELLNYELQRLGTYLPVKGKICYDSYDIEKQFNSNKLGSVYKRYMGKTMEEDGLFAHNALSDVKATIEIFKKQVQMYDIDLDKFFLESPKKIIQLNENKEYVFTLGKYKERLVEDIMKQDTSYISWLVGSNQGQVEFLTLLKNIYTNLKQKQNETK